MLSALATSNSFSPSSFSFIRNKNESLVRQREHTLDAQQGRAGSWERSPTGEAGGGRSSGLNRQHPAPCHGTGSGDDFVKTSGNLY